MTPFFRTSLVLANRSFQDEVVFEEVSREAGQSYCGPGGGYEDTAECRKTTTERHVPSAVVSGTTVQQKTFTYSVPDRSKKASVYAFLLIALLYARM